MTTLGRRCCASICANKCTSAGDVQHVSTPTWGLGPKDLNTITGQNQNYLVFQTICLWIKAREVSGFLMCRIPCWRMLKATATSKNNHGNIDWMVVAIRICPPLCPATMHLLMTRVGQCAAYPMPSKYGLSQNRRCPNCWNCEIAVYKSHMCHGQNMVYVLWSSSHYPAHDGNSYHDGF
jgi:hypothetical protein